MHSPSPQQPQGTPVRRRSRLTRYLAIAMILLITPIFAMAATVAATGLVTVQVSEKQADGMNLYIPVPALLLDMAVFAAPMVLPNDALAEVRTELAPFRSGLRAFADELADMPSGTLVEVQDGDEHVRIAKTFRTFEITVESHDADVSVSVSVPSRLMSRALDIF